MKVKDVMTTGVQCVRRDESLSAAARLMWDCDCGTLPVQNDEDDRLVGMITDRDICMATWSKDRPPSNIQVWEAMSPNLYYCSPDDSLSTAEDVMRSRRIRRLPVLDANRRLVGLLSLADIATEAQRLGARATSADLGPVEIAATLAGICEPRPNRHSSATA
jgi:CBS domain-containing protein